MQLSYYLRIRECPEARAILENAGYKLRPVYERINFFGIELLECQRVALPELGPYILPGGLISKRYAKDELRAAEWLGIRAAWQQYEITNKEKSVFYPCESCFSNWQQIGTYRISGTIKKARKAFLTPSGTNDLLARDDARALLEHSDLKGFHFREIICNHKDSALQRFSQMVIENTLPPAMKYDEADYAEQKICKSCGTYSFVVKGSAILKMDKAVMKQANQDIYFSHEQQGGGFYRSKIISGRFYRLLAENGFGNDITVDDIVKLV